MPSLQNNPWKSTTGRRTPKYERIGLSLGDLLRLLREEGSYRGVARLTGLSAPYIREQLKWSRPERYLKKRASVIKDYLNTLPLGEKITIKALAEACSTRKDCAAFALRRYKREWKERALRMVGRFLKLHKAVYTVEAGEVASWGVSSFEIERGLYRDLFLVRLYMKNGIVYHAKFTYEKKTERNKEDGTSAP